LVAVPAKATGSDPRGTGFFVLGLFKRRRRADEQQTAATAMPALALLKIEGASYVFGLDWRLVPPKRRLSRTLAMARQEGQAWCALSEMEDVVGFLANPQWLRGRHYSACLHLASRLSQGGLELFAFAISEQQHAVLALQESRPLPGFDYLGEPATARAMVEEFMAIQRGQPMRLVGNTDYLEGQEEISPDDVFVEPAKSARLRSLRSWRALRRGLVFAVLAVAVGFAVMRYLEYRREETLTALQGSPAYQQRIYQQELDAAWASLPPSSAVVLRGWWTVLSSLPLRVQGWRLLMVECEIENCRAHWQRQHGSYTDFLNVMPAGASGVDESASDQDLMAGRLVTRHPLPQAETTAELDRAGLPPLLQARRVLADQMQDLQLLGPAQVQVEPAQLFGGQFDPQILVEPVFSGQWRLRHGLWLLPLLALPDFARVQSLRVDMATGAAVAAASSFTDAAGAQADPAPMSETIKSQPRAGDPYFEIKGSYYAHK
jgi:hypothetical protein